MEQISFYSKTFAETCNDELKNLSVLCRPKGDSFFRIFLENLKEGTVKNPERIIITQAIKQNKPVAWLFEDCAGEYNKYKIAEEHCSIHVFCAHSEREQGIAQCLFEFRQEQLKSHSKIIAYVEDSIQEFQFYTKIKDRLQLNLKIESPIYYPIQGKNGTLI